MTVETGHFEKFSSVVCLMYGEYTLCGDAFDADSDHNFGEWIPHDTPRAVTCAECRRVIRVARSARLSTVERVRSESDV